MVYNVRQNHELPTCNYLYIFFDWAYTEFKNVVNHANQVVQNFQGLSKVFFFFLLNIHFLSVPFVVLILELEGKSSFQVIFVNYVCIIKFFLIDFDYILLKFVIYAALLQKFYCQKSHTFKGKTFFLKFSQYKKYDIQKVWAYIPNKPAVQAAGADPS